jgi:hypothetical protein
MRPVAFGEALSAGTRLTLFSDDKPDRFFTIIKFWMDETSGLARAPAQRTPHLHQIPSYGNRVPNGLRSRIGCDRQAGETGEQFST